MGVSRGIEIVQRECAWIAGTCLMSEQGRYFVLSPSDWIEAEIRDAEIDIGDDGGKGVVVGRVVGTQVRANRVTWDEMVDVSEGDIARIGQPPPATYANGGIEVDADGT
jgi:hypothetical protein